MRLSIIVPIFNERENIKPLVEKVLSQFHNQDFELILVDDGSDDGSDEVLAGAAKNNSHVKIITLNKNYGQTAAIAAGIDASGGDVIVPMDGDLENDPNDIPQLLAKLNEGFDVVSGWRKDRWNNKFFTRKLPSAFANWLVSRVSGLALHDYGCTLKAYRAEVLKRVRLYGDMHRFIPAYAFWSGAKIAEVPVSYNPRRFGVSKYGIGRVKGVILDLVLMRFLAGYAQRPLRFFGNIGYVFVGIGGLAGALAVYYKLSAVHQKDFVETPLPVIMAMFVVVGILFVMMGLLAEIIMRTYHEAQGKRIYSVKEKVGF